MKRVAWKLGIVLAVSVLRLIDSMALGAKQVSRGDAAAGRSGDTGIGNRSGAGTVGGAAGGCTAQGSPRLIRYRVTGRER
jgi:hypothetical protein